MTSFKNSSPLHFSHCTFFQSFHRFCLPFGFCCVTERRITTVLSLFFAQVTHHLRLELNFPFLGGLPPARPSFFLLWLHKMTMVLVLLYRSNHRVMVQLTAQLDVIVYTRYAHVSMFGPRCSPFVSNRFSPSFVCEKL